MEASFVMSLFLLSICLLFYFFHLMEFQIQLQFALEETARAEAISQTSSFLGERSFWGRIEKEVTKTGKGLRINSDSLKVVYNAEGVFPSEEDILDVFVCYQAGPELLLFGPLKGSYVQRCRRRRWTGQASVGQDSTKEGETEEYVYITQNGAVYHRKRECTYLKLSIRAADGNSVSGLRNEEGSKYRPCERCMKNVLMPGTVYITDTGDRYHRTRNCSGLNRWIMKVPLSQVGGKGPCSRCGADTSKLENNKNYVKNGGGQNHVSCCLFGSVYLLGLPLSKNTNLAADSGNCSGYGNLDDSGGVRMGSFAECDSGNSSEPDGMAASRPDRHGGWMDDSGSRGGIWMERRYIAFGRRAAFYVPSSFFLRDDQKEKGPYTALCSVHVGRVPMSNAVFLRTE
ncbi:hypothetical protein [Qiania dongpingensis]|nr:hypothetical protein [Qiania dongpingensis]